MCRSGIRRGVVFLATAAVVISQPLLAPAAALAPATATGSDAQVSTSLPPNKGPVGWQAYRQLDRLPELTTGVQTEQFSSVDPGVGNGDYNNNLAHVSDGCLLAEHQGPGEIDSMWSTRE